MGIDLLNAEAQKVFSNNNSNNQDLQATLRSHNNRIDGNSNNYVNMMAQPILKMRFKQMFVF